MRRLLAALAPLVLAFSAVVTAGDDAAADPATIVSLDRRGPFAFKSSGQVHAGTLLHELMRQAVLIAARDELGCATRDDCTTPSAAFDADNYAWLQEWDKEIKPELLRLIFDSLRRHPSWSVHVRNRGLSPLDEVEIAMVRDFNTGRSTVN